MNRRFGLLAAGGLAVALVAVGGTALATTTGPVNGNVITGCYTNAEVNGSHAVVLQDGGASCPKGTSAITWNQTGPAGPAGAAGPQGPAGATGATGATGAAGTSGTNGTDGTNGTNGTNGVSPAVVPFTGSEGNCTSGGEAITDANEATTYVCDGTDGTAGPAGLAGPAGPAGPAGSGVSSLDDMNGMPCQNGAGTTSVGYGAGTSPVGAGITTYPVSVTCTVPTTGTPGSSEINPIFIYTTVEAANDELLPGLGQTCASTTPAITETGTITNASGSPGAEYYEFNIYPNGTTCNINVSVTPSIESDAPTGGAAMTISYVDPTTGALSDTQHANSIFNIPGGSQTPTAVFILVEVTWEPFATSGSYTLAIGNNEPCTLGC